MDVVGQLRSGGALGKGVSASPHIEGKDPPPPVRSSLEIKYFRNNCKLSARFLSPQACTGVLKKF